MLLVASFKKQNRRAHHYWRWKRKWYCAVGRHNHQQVGRAFCLLFFFSMREGGSVNELFNAQRIPR